jgi:hypothetical protein
VRRGNRSRNEVLGRIAGLSLIACGLAEAPVLTPLPAPLSSFLASHPQARLSAVASGLTGARNLRLQPDGSLLLDAPGESLEYRLAARTDGGADVLLSARELGDGRGQVSRGLTTLVDLEWLPRERATDELELPPERFQVVEEFARVPETDVALAPDGTVFVADLAAGFVYRVTFPPATSAE